MAFAGPRRALLANSGRDPGVIFSNYASRVSVAGGVLSNAESAALLSFLSRALAAGYWSKLIDAAPFCGGFAGSKVKIKFLNTASFVLNNFVAGDYNANVGLTGDGSTKWGLWGTKFSDFAASGRGGLAAFVTGGNPSAFGSFVAAQVGSGPQFFLCWNGSPTGTVTSAVNGSGTNVTMPTSMTQLATGMYHLERAGPSSATLYGGGSQLKTSAATAALNTTSAVIALFSDTNGNNKFAGSIGFAALTNGTMTATDAKAFARHVSQLMRALGRTGTATQNAYYLPVIGQSLARGANGTPISSTTQSYQNRRPATGIVANNPGDAQPLVWNAATPAMLVPLTESSLETIASGALNTISASVRAAGGGDTWDMATENWGVGATAYSGLKKGTGPYNNSVSCAGELIAGIAPYSGADLRVPAIFCVHGESDAASATYQTDIRTWQSDYETDFAAYKLNTRLPIFHSQPSSWTSTFSQNAPTALSPYAILAEHETNPTRTLLVCPKYFFQYSAADGVHLINGAAYRKLGEYYGKAFYTQLILGQQWDPLRPSVIQRTSNVVTVTFAGCVGNLVLDTTLVSDPGNYGFEWSDGSSQTISSVSVSGNQATITLSGAPTGTMALRYAYTGIAGNFGGPTTGPRGCLRDSDTFAGEQGAALPNWCVHFNKSVT